MKINYLKKQFIAVGIGIAMLNTVFLSSLPAMTVEAADTFYYNNKNHEIHISGDYSYIVVQNEALITKYNGSAGTVSIPTEIDGMKVTSVLMESFKDNSSIQTLTIPSGIKNIEERAFLNCSGLQQVLFSSTVTEIGDEAFCNCAYLQKIAFQSDGLKSIGEKAFAYCAALDDVVFPESLESLGGAAFYGCSSLSKIRIVDKITELNDADDYMNDGNSTNYRSGIFENCTSLSEVIIGKGVKTIGTDTFANTALTKVDIPDNVEILSQGAFYDCKELAEVTGGSSLKEIGDYAFYNNISLGAITFGKKLMTIGESAFMYNNSLIDIVIPSNVENMGSACFYGCEALESVDIGNGVTAIDTRDKYDEANYNRYRIGAFENCKSLVNVIIGNGVKSIGEDAFAGTALQSLTIPDNVVTIDSGAFYNCEALTNVVIGNGVTTIGDKAFYHNDSLKNITLGKNVVSIGEGCFAFDKALEELLIPSSVTNVGGGMCYNCSSLKKVIIGNGVTEIYSEDKYVSENKNSSGYKSGIFENCTQLSDVSLGSGLTKIGIDSFASTKVTSLLIPAKVSSIEQGGFYNIGMSNLYFTGAAPEFGEDLFGETKVPVMNNIAGKSGYDKLEYNFHEFTPVTVKYDINNSDVFTIAPSNQLMAPEGGYVIEPIDPVAEGYLFLGWYHEKACTNKWDFMEDKVTKDTTIYAKWVKVLDTVPVAPKPVEIESTTSKTATVKWDAVEGAVSYQIYVDGKLCNTAPVTACEYTIQNLSADTSYEITISAINNKGESAKSLVKVLRTGEAKDDPAGDNSGDNNNGDNNNEDDNNGDNNNGGDSTVSTLSGDVDLNNKVDLNDATLSLKAAVGIGSPLSGQAEINADVNNDQKVDLNDARLVLCIAVGITT